ncbi:MAG TPA: 3-methyl-2-oxobutanoate dehydrogenase subunit VorB [Candidatus Omnitrophota bacterium]|nr:3-methyl-2-oxobutanoate dehydrogenase subunit VorB [Candidatus Omnitrophota bacterium]HRY85371.1 3-methyl-2-oxobutanoate dehydrogenase subunit VorB [Candidatus Omnitrophota bacterium]
MENEKTLVMGNVAMSEAAVRAGCRFYAGYPITPQNEVSEYLAKRLPEVGGVFVQAESELAAINMVFGAASTGERAMTSSSSPGISLMQEAISYLAAAQIPCLIANIMRGGPGLGNIQGSQADYFQATRGGGHGDYRLIVLAPWSVQEMYDLTIRGFELGDQYRNPVMLLADGILGQMAESIELKKPGKQKPVPKNWALTGCAGRKPNVVRTLYLQEKDALEQKNAELQAKYELITRELQLSEARFEKDAEIAVIAYGTSARIAHWAVKRARESGIKVGLFRPITLWPFPATALREIAAHCRKLLVVEMSQGQMIEDVRLSRIPATGVDPKIEFLGRGGGWYPKPKELLAKIMEIAK